MVNAAGAWAADIASSAGVELPIRPISRQVFAVKPPLSIPIFPLVIAPSGLYFRPRLEDSSSLAAPFLKINLISILPGLGPDSKIFFWPELVEIVPSFTHLKLIRGWTGLYDQNLLDSNAVFRSLA